MFSPLTGPVHDVREGVSRSEQDQSINADLTDSPDPAAVSANRQDRVVGDGPVPAPACLPDGWDLMHRCTRHRPGSDTHLLLCSESMISSSPSDESVKSCQEFSSKQWLQNGIQKHGCVGNGSRPNSKEAHIVTDKQEVRSPAYHKVYASSFSRSAVTKTTSVLQPLPAQNPLAGRGDESPLERRMNTNGYDRSRLTGPSGSGSAPNSESPAWLSEVSPPSHAHPPRAPVEGMLASRLISSQEGHLVLSSGSQGPQGPLSSSLFRPPATLFPGAVAQYSPSLYTTSSTGPLYSSSMYTLHGQPTPLASVSPYTSLYPQIAAAAATNYGHGSLLQSHYPQIESYSAVLAHMGSHVQQSQLPRSPYLTAAHLPQFSALSPAVPSASSAHAHMTAANTPHLPGHAAEILKPDSAGSKGKMGGDYESRGRLTSAPLPAPHAKSLSRPAPLSSPTHGKTGNKVRDAIKQERIGSPKDLAYKGVPCGKEGSLKHRILTRPPDIHIEGSSLPDVKGMLSARVKTEVSSPKRTKASASISHLPTVAEIGPGVNESGHSAVLSGGHPPQQAGSQPHYPAHFMKGSIIELASGDYKRVEDLQTEDFSNSAEISKDLKIDSSTVVRIQENYERGTALLSFSVGEHKVQVTVEATLEHPFFVFGRGWSSFSPARTLQRYELECHKLAVGDVCISLTHKDVTTHAAELNRQAADLRRKSRTGPGSVRFTTPTRVPPPSRVLSLEEGQQQLSIKDKERKPGDKDSAGSLLSGISLDDVPSRKRRWSAPDQVSLENEEAPPSKQSPGVRGSNSPGSEPSRGDT